MALLVEGYNHRIYNKTKYFVLHCMTEYVLL